MQQICAEAQMSPGALYRYYPSKDAIIEAIAEEERIQVAACMQGLAGGGSIVDRITAVAMDYLRETRDPETGGLLVEICSESIRNTAVGKRFHEVEKEVRNAFLASLRTAQADGEIDADVELESALFVLFALGDGLLMRLQIEPNIGLESIERYLRRSIAGILGEPRRPALN